MPTPRFLFAHPGDLHASPLDALVPHLRGHLHCEFVQLRVNCNDDELVEEVVRRLGEGSGHVVVGGFSLGARIAAMASLRVPVAGLIGLSFPFHRHGQPLEQHGLATLRSVVVKTLLIQGTRDSHGSQAQVRGVGPLPSQIEVMWLRDANHRWRSRQPGLSVQNHAKDAALAIQTFLQGLVSRPHV